MKKMIPFFMALVMAVSMPVGASASSGYEISKKMSAEENTRYDNNRTPAILEMTVNTKMERGEVFRLILDNASFEDEDGDFIWAYSYNSSSSSAKKYKSDALVTETSKNYVFNASYAGRDVSTSISSALAKYFILEKISDTQLEFQAIDTVPADTYIRIPLYCLVTDPGEATVSIDPWDSSLSKLNDLVFCEVEAEYGQIISVDRTVNITTEPTEIGSIIFEETYTGSIYTPRRGETIKIVAPDGFEFEDIDDVTVTLTGSLLSANRRWDNYSISYDKTSSRTYRDILLVELNDIDESTSGKGTLVISGIVLSVVENDVTFGDVILRVSGFDQTNEKLTVGSFKEYAFQFSPASGQLPILNAAYSPGASGLQAQALKTVVLQEAAAGTLEPGDRVEISVPDGFRINKVDIESTNLSTDVDKTFYNQNSIVSEPLGGGTIRITDDRIIFTDLTAKDNRRIVLNITVYVDVTSGLPDQDIALTFSGRSFESQLKATVGRLQSTVSATVAIGSNVITTSDGKTVYMDEAAYIDSGRTMLPFRSVAVALGIDENYINWNGTDKIVTVFNEGTTIQVKIGDRYLTKNGERISMLTEATIKGGRTFIPVAELANALDVPYRWDEQTRTVVFNPAQ